MKKYVKPNFTNIFLNVTDECNLRCKYCFVAKHPHYMTLKVAKDTVDLIIDINKDRYEKEKTPSSIQFFGGEPTLMWDSIIVPTVEYAKEKGVLNTQLTFGITSNCILLDSKKMDFLKEHGIGLLFSIDGDKKTQDFNRPCVNPCQSSFDILEPKIPEIVNKFHPTFRATLTPETCGDLFNNIMFAAKYKFQNCFFIPDAGPYSKWTEESKNIMKDEVRKYSLYFIDCYRRGIVPFSLESYTRSFDYIRRNEYWEKQGEISTPESGFCGLGYNTASVGYDGSIYGCQQLASMGTHNNPYYLGDIYKGIDVVKREKLLNMFMTTNRKSSEDGRCEGCAFRRVCQTATCHANCYMYSGDISCKAAIECFWDELTFKEALFVTNVLVANENQMFMDKYDFIPKGQELENE